MNELAHLLTLADTFMAATGLKEITLSHRIFGDSKKLTALRAGSDITLGRFNGAIGWFSTNWPEGAEWPDTITRPEIVAPAEGEAA